jgi:hypothetical protein
MGSRTIPVPQLPASKSNSSQRLNCSSSHSLTHPLTNSFLPCTAQTVTNCPDYNISAWTAHKTFPVTVQLLLSGLNRKHRSSVNPFVHVRNLLPNSGRCLQDHYLVTGLHATILMLLDFFSPSKFARSPCWCSYERDLIEYQERIFSHCRLFAICFKCTNWTYELN